MCDPRRLILLLLVGVVMAACGPTIETRHSYTPPGNPGGMACVRECEQSRAYCVSNAQVSQQMCKADARRHAEIEYRAYLRTLKRGEKPKRSISYYDDSYSCRSEESRCKGGFNECYAACGGQVVTQRFCTSDCDQLEPPLPPLAQVGPTLVNGVAQRPPVPAIQKTTAGQNNAGKAAQRTSAAPVGTEVVFLASRYRIRGIDHDGSEYDGTVTVRPEGGRYRIRWSIGSEIYNGVGMLAGDRLSIDGNSDDDQFRYDLRLLSDGSLTGTWTSGGDERGSEEWSPS